MKYINLLIPSFLQRFDNHLMLHSPHVWRTRVHFVAFYAVVAWAILFCIGLMYPLSMYDISRTPYAVEELKQVSFLFLLICGFFAVVYWWQQVVKFRILAAKWYHSFIECGLFFIGIFMVWQVVNAFKNGIDTNIAYRVGRNISVADKAKLYERNFYLPGYIYYNADDQFRDLSNEYVSIDSVGNQFFKEAEKLLKIYHKRIHREGVVLDSQYYTKNDERMFIHNDRIPYLSNESFVYNRGSYYEWLDSINTKSRKYIKPHMEYESRWDDEDNRLPDKKVLVPFKTYDAFILDSVYNLFNAYDKYQVDSVKNYSVNSMIDNNRKNQNYNLVYSLSGLMRRDILSVLDTCSNVFFNNKTSPYIDILKSKCQAFELDFQRNQILNVFSKSDSLLYKKYLLEIISMMPLKNRAPIEDMEVGLYYKRDSLAISFINSLSKRSKKIYISLITFYINNCIEKGSASTIAGNFRWNKLTNKYSEIEKYASSEFIDTVLFYADSALSKEFKNTLTFNETCNILNLNVLNRVYTDVEQWRRSKDTFFITYGYRNKNRNYENYIVKKLRRDSIPIDTIFKWFTINSLGLEYNRDKKNRNKPFYFFYKKYRDSQISEQDSTFLDNVYTRCSYIQDSSEHSRLFFHANAYYLYLADININKSRGFLSGWNPFYLSTNNKLGIIILSFLMFFTSLAQSNLFTAAFVAFFINFVNNTFFNLGQNFQEVDKNKQTFWLFGLLGILALVTAFNILFRKFKLPIIHLLINIQLFALLGIFVWLFDSQTIEQQRNYAYLSIAFWGLMVWQYRGYLALPSRK